MHAHIPLRFRPAVGRLALSTRRHAGVAATLPWLGRKRTLHLTINPYQQQRLKPVSHPAARQPPSRHSLSASPASSVTPRSSLGSCLGCGASFQTDFEHQAGFIPHNVWQTYQQKLTSIPDKQERRLTDVEDAELVSANTHAEADATHATVIDEASQQLLDPSNDRPTYINGIEVIDKRQGRELKRQAKASAYHQRRGSKAIQQQLQKEHKADNGNAVVLPNLLCSRCHQLRHYGHTRGVISTVSAGDFRALLQARFLDSQFNSAVVLHVIDVVDLHGSIIHDIVNLIGGRNPIIIVVNKCDLLPRGVGENRLRAWIKQEIRQYGLKPHDVQLISSITGDGIPGMMRKAAELANTKDQRQLDQPRDIYLVGTTNVGKSTLINKLTDMRYILARKAFESIEPRHRLSAGERFDPPMSGKANAISNVTLDVRSTASLQPGTTLGIVGFPLIPQRQGTIFDSPGVIPPQHLHSMMTYDELRVTVPTSRISPITYRVKENQTLLLGGLVRVDLVSGKPFYATVFASKHMTVHCTNADNLIGNSVAANDEESKQAAVAEPQSSNPIQHYFHKHVGKLFSPPFSAERFDALGLCDATAHTFDVHGLGWEESACDIVLPGVGWIAWTGSGDAVVRVSMAGGIPPHQRASLMPYDAHTNLHKFHGASRKM